MKNFTEKILLIGRCSDWKKDSRQIMSCTKQQRFSQQAYCFTQSISFQQFCGVNKSKRGIKICQSLKHTNYKSAKCSVFTKLCSIFQQTLSVDTFCAAVSRNFARFGSHLLTASRNGWWLVVEWLACWTQPQKGLGSNRSRDAVG